jgi:TonB-linked SusC/RagA family outer membrane protein
MEKQFLRRLISALALMLAVGCFSKGFAQTQTPTQTRGEQRTVKGIVLDQAREPVIGASVVVKGSTGVGTTTDIDGRFTLSNLSGEKTLIISYIGMKTVEVKTQGQTQLNVVMEEDDIMLDEVIVVGYGQQEKKSVVGAITQTNAKTLQKYDGVGSLGQALTGNLPGLITYSSTGMPGEEEPKIVIRSQTSWNNSDPLVLVDGIERPMSSVDITSVETISVLKDASATAVYGVKGANGVILITTKRGAEGKATVNLKANMTMKVVSKLPAKYDSYDTFILKNETIEKELADYPTGWANYKPMAIINKYRYPANDEEWDRYPNVDWESEMFKTYTTSYSANANVTGGSQFVKYFASVDFVHEGDLFKDFTTTRGYNSNYSFNRLNLRANSDFKLTPTTDFSVNLFGSNGVRTTPWGGSVSDGFWNSVYQTAPDAFRPIYSDGVYGYFAPRDADAPNAIANLSNAGIEQQTTMRLNTDFILAQNLSFITKGLTFRGSLTVDNNFREEDRGINDEYNYVVQKWINPETGDVSWKQGDDFTETVRWSTQAGSVNTGATYRKIYYQLQLNYARKFGKHDVTAMGLFSRDKYATGSEFAHYREDWVFRTTYNYDSRYFAEINGAYNGSEKFGPAHRFEFFPSFSAGWMLSGEKFMESMKWMDMVKFRASWGRIGDDNVGGRWLYQNQWSYGGSAIMGSPTSTTPYTIYRVSTLGNADLSWETVDKRNFGVDYSFFKGLAAGSFDIYKDKRTDILISGGSRAVPTYFGFQAPTANLGEVESHGWEWTLRSNYVINNAVRLYGQFNMTHATNKVLFADDPQLKAAYRKSQGYTIGQTRTYLDEGHIRTWDDVYGSTERLSNNDYKYSGDYLIMDFNGDGVIDDNDQAPYRYSGVPQNTYSTTVGVEYQNFQLSLQFYGVSNVTRQVNFPTFNATKNIAYVEGTYYTIDNGGDIPYPRWTSVAPTGSDGTRFYYDGSYLRLKNMELAYTFQNSWVKAMRIKALRLYLNGDNLLLWTSMPDDRESNFSGAATSGAYPTMRRFNLGINITL